MRRTLSIVLLAVPLIVVADPRAGALQAEVDAGEVVIEVRRTESDDGPRVSLERVRTGLAANWRRRVGEAWQVRSGLRIERRRGQEVVANVTGTTGGNARAVLVAAPIEHDTREFTAGAVYRTGNHQLAAHGLLASFSTGQPMRAPGNRANEFGLGWAWRDPAAGPQLNIDYSTARHRQDESILPFTVDRDRVGARALWPLADNVDLDLRWRDERQNEQTPAMQSAITGRLRVPRDFRTQRGDLALAWRIARRDRLRIEWMDESRDRSYAEVAETHERGAAVEWRRTGVHAAHLRVDRLRREAGEYRFDLPWLAQHTDAYIATVDPALRFENHPLLRRFNLADRTRDQARAGWSWSGEAWHFATNAHLREDRYTDSVFGLTDSLQRGWHVEAGHRPGESTSWTGWMSQERWDSAQDGRHFRGAGFFAGDFNNSARDWTARSEDRSTAVGLGWRHRAPWQDGELAVDLSHSRSDADVRVTAGAAIATAPHPTVTTRVDRVSVSATHRLRRGLRLRVGVDHERWTARDWAWDAARPTTVQSLLGLAERGPDFNLTWVSVSLEWRP